MNFNQIRIWQLAKNLQVIIHRQMHVSFSSKLCYLKLKSPGTSTQNINWKKLNQTKTLSKMTQTAIMKFFKQDLIVILT